MEMNSHGTEPSSAGSVQKVDPLLESGWDALVMTHPGHVVFHGSAWAEVLRNTYGFKPVYFTVREGRRLLGLLPTMEASGWLKGRRGVSLPFSDFCPLLTCDSIPGRVLLGHAIKHGTVQGWKYFEWRGCESHADLGLKQAHDRELTSMAGLNQDSRAEVNAVDGFGPINSAPLARPLDSNLSAPALSPSLGFHGHVIQLARDEPAQFRRFDSGVRRAIRKAEWAGVKVEITRDFSAVRAFYGLHCQTRRKHGLPPQPFLFFENIHRAMLSRDLGFVSLASLGGQPVAGAIFFHLGRKAVYKYGASDERCLQARGNNLVMWEAIKWYIRHRFAVLHLGRTSLENEGLRRFKRGWSAEECRLQYYRFSYAIQELTAMRDEAFGWQNRIFRLLPMRMSRWLGVLMYKQMA
jgi:hypothetical protein